MLVINWMDLANPLAGGAEVQLVELFTRFVARGDRVTLLSSGFQGAKREDNYQGIRIIRSGTRTTFNFTVPRLVRHLDRLEHFDLIVEDINKVPFFTPLYSKKPLLIIIPHLFGATVFRETNPLFASYVYLMERPIPLIYRHALFSVVSESTKQDLISRGISPERIHVVHCGVDHTRYSYDPEVQKFSKPTILCVARVKKYKSIDVIIRAMPEVMNAVTDVQLVIVGSGDYLSALKHLTQKMKLTDRVTFTGYVREEDKVDWMRKSHVIVNPSPKEGWGLTNIEANACGTPAVASDAPGLRDSVQDGETGLLFPYGDTHTLALKLDSILHDNNLREKLSKNAISRAQTFTWDDSAQKTTVMVDELMSQSVRNNS
jgi:glycosyltransferase involved in cell wall biosynthesis